MNHRRLTLILATILTLSTLVPMICAPVRQPDKWGDPIGNLIEDRDDPALIGPANTMRTAINNLERTEDQLDFDPATKSLSQLSPREQAMILRAYNRAAKQIHQFKIKAVLYDKSLDTIETKAVNYINLPPLTQ